MSEFDEAVIQRIKQLEREVERLKRWERPIGGGGVTDHGLLSGLSDDDHTQYLNTTRHDTTTRHMLGTVVPHDDHGQLTGLADDDHAQYTKHPASSTDNAIVRWDGTGGRTIQNSGVTIDDSNNIKVGTAPVPTSVTSSTDNAIVRFDGTGGNKIQNSLVIINDSGQLSGNGLDGWIYDTDTWTYVSATSFKITGKDVRYKFPKGTKIKLVQSGITKYFYVTATAYSADTTITITGGSDYSLANATISGQAYSYVAAPQDFPLGTSTFVPLTTPLTSTSWDGDARSTTAKTKIDLSAVFGVPAGVKAVLAVVVVRDSASAANDCYLTLSPNNTNPSDGIHFDCSGLANDKWERGTGIIPCNVDGDVYYKIGASGTDTLDAIIEIWGWWL